MVFVLGLQQEVGASGFPHPGEGQELPCCLTHGLGLMQTEPLEEQQAWCLHGGLHVLATHLHVDRVPENINYDPLAIIKFHVLKLI